MFTAVCAACGAPTEPSVIFPGTWGGDHATLTVANSSSHMEFDCAHGDMPGVLSTTKDQFAVSGTFVREHGGPIRVDESLDSHPAVYSGTLSGNTMQLSVRLTDSGEIIGPFALARGTAGRVVKCL
jgi:hypothetical protein